MIIKKAAACAAVFIVLLLWGWLADRNSRNVDLYYTDIMKEYNIYSGETPKRLDRFQPREYVRLIRYGDMWIPEKIAGE
ncbi:hypothetical protein [Paenibacillus abyssi]|uniref:Uncharacterized protein n=1 Tax=Paenibacillus abyssi TaxID=1340531 RepID=A0A917G2M7_9BACL|nr:hypothetical protein [Paenibacillus abyssi]GGG20112.1 hypothetical protein GCM10010916_41080 [Paenibacillus abyssi]